MVRQAPPWLHSPPGAGILTAPKRTCRAAKPDSNFAPNPGLFPVACFGCRPVRRRSRSNGPPARRPSHWPHAGAVLRGKRSIRRDVHPARPPPRPSRAIQPHEPGFQSHPPAPPPSPMPGLQTPPRHAGCRHESMWAARLMNHPGRLDPEHPHPELLDPGPQTSLGSPGQALPRVVLRDSRWLESPSRNCRPGRVPLRRNPRPDCRLDPQRANAPAYPGGSSALL